MCGKKMINFSSISTTANMAMAKATKNNVKAQPESTQQKAVINFSSYEYSNSMAAIKNQAAMFTMKFNNNFYSSVQYLNAKAANDMHSHNSAKAFVSQDLPKAS